MNDLVREVQACVFPGIKARSSCMLYGRIINPSLFREFLNTLFEDICFASDWFKKKSASNAIIGDIDGQVFVNLAFTARGLLALGFSPSLHNMDSAFVNSSTRSGSVLRDWPSSGAREETLAKWKFTDSSIEIGNEVDFIVLLAAPSPQTAQLSAKRLILQLNGATLVGRFPGFRRGFELSRPWSESAQREHFGFRDPITNPTLALRIAGREDYIPIEVLNKLTYHVSIFSKGKVFTRPSSIILTSSESFDEIPDYGNLLEFGSYVVLRRYRQFIDKFDNFIRELSSATKGFPDEPSYYEADNIAAQLMGRYKSGCPIVMDEYLSSEASRNSLKTFNDFLFDHYETSAVIDGSVRTLQFSPDKIGRNCPRTAHTRVSNERRGPTQLGPMMIRRGSAYGPNVAESTAHDARDSVDRGLNFIAYMRSISDQFESLHVSGFLGRPNERSQISRSLVDPIVSAAALGLEDAYVNASTPGTGAIQTTRIGRFHNRNFLNVTGSAYAFAPSRSMLSHLIG